jgi:hypothetical protein
MTAKNSNDSACLRLTPWQRRIDWCAELSGLSLDELQFILWLRRQAPDVKRTFVDMIQDAIEMTEEGYTIEEIKIYLRRMYGLVQ